MASQKAQTKVEIPHLDSPCWKKKAPETGFFTNIKDNFDEFVNTPVEQHKICLKKTFRGVGKKLKKSGSMFGSSKVESGLGAKEVENSPPQATTSH